MTEALVVYLCCTTILILVVAVFIPRMGNAGLQFKGLPIRRGGGGIVNRIARLIVLTLGRITFSTLHLFQRLGVDMTNPNIDETLASWTNWSQDVKAKLAAALQDAQKLRDTDAAEDAAQANALSESLAKKVQDAFDAVTSEDAPTPVGETPAEEVPGPPATPPSSDVPVVDVPVADPALVDEEDATR